VKVAGDIISEIIMAAVGNTTPWENPAMTRAAEKLTMSLRRYSDTAISIIFTKPAMSVPLVEISDMILGVRNLLTTEAEEYKKNTSATTFASKSYVVFKWTG
ncbi:MAG: hypothetical protein GTO54_08730, partial [Nitrososphaeria archaeon]|nr:hypothetical protein [Nitrososphaeria archaeon]